jgi:hypothetical protein
MQCKEMVADHSEDHMMYILLVGRPIGQAVSRWLPTAAARVQTRV